MKTIILKRMLILIIPVFLFLGGYQAKADTFTYIDWATWAAGGSGFDGCNCHFNYTLQTDKLNYAFEEYGYLSGNYWQDGNTVNPITQAGIKLAIGNSALEGYPMNYTMLPFPFRVGYDVWMTATSSSWSSSEYWFFVQPDGEYNEWNPSNPEGSSIFIINYDGSFDIDNENVSNDLYTYFYIPTPTPSNNNPQVNVR